MSLGGGLIMWGRKGVPASPGPPGDGGDRPASDTRPGMRDSAGPGSGS